MSDEKPKVEITPSNKRENKDRFVTIFNVATTGPGKVLADLLHAKPLGNLSGTSKNNNETFGEAARDKRYKHFLAEIGPNVEVLINQGPDKTARGAYKWHRQEIARIKQLYRISIQDNNFLERQVKFKLLLLRLKAAPLYHLSAVISDTDLVRIIPTYIDLMQHIGPGNNNKISPAMTDRIMEHILNSATIFPYIINNSSYLSGFSVNFARYANKAAMRILTNPIDFDRVIENEACLNKFIQYFSEFQELAKKTFQDREIQRKTKNNASLVNTSPNSSSTSSGFSSMLGRLFQPVDTKRELKKNAKPGGQENTIPPSVPKPEDDDTTPRCIIS